MSKRAIFTSITLSVFLTMLIFVSISAMGKKESLNQPHSTPNDALSTTLNVCLSDEPSTLYPYGNDNDSKSIILEAVYDGPIDMVNYGPQPVIIQKIPTLENGGALLQAVSVAQGDTIVDAYGSVVSLSPGDLIFPSGCYSQNCAITYTGGAVQMDQFEVTFDLLPDLTWSDGTPLTASDSVYSFNLDADPGTPTDKFTTDRTASYTAASGTQTVWRGLPGFLDSTYTGNFWTPYPEHIWEAFSASQLLTEPISSRTPPGYGPYIITAWVQGSYVSLIENPNYYRFSEGLPFFKNLTFHFSSDIESDLLAGICDLAPNVSISLTNLKAYENAGLLRLVSSPGTVWENMNFGIVPASYDDGWQQGDRPNFFEDVSVRRAFAYCIDRQTVADIVYEGLGSVPPAYVPKDHPYYPNDATEYPFDPVQGQTLLVSAGWIDHDGNPSTPRIYQGADPKIPNGTPFTVSYWTTTVALRQQAAALIAADMLNNCGIQLDTAFWDPGLFFSDWPNGPVFGRSFDLATFAWLTGADPPCYLYLSGNISSGANPGGSNAASYNNPQFDTACGAASTSLLEGDKLANHSEAIRIFTNDLPTLPLFYRLRIGAAAPDILGFTLDPAEVPLWNIETINRATISVIPTSGGALSSPVDQTDYIFPGGTFTGTVKATHKPVFFKNAPSPGGLLFIQHVFEVTVVFSDTGQIANPTLPFTITVGYSNAEKRPVKEETLGLYYWDGNQSVLEPTSTGNMANSQWVLEPTSSVNTANNTITATPMRLGLWAVLGDTNRTYLPIITR